MIKVLYVGDPHFKSSQKDEMEQLMIFVRDSAFEHNVDQIVILGDLNDTFGVLRTDNQVFWEKWLTELSAGRPKLYVLVGNHDKKNQGNDDDDENSLSVFNLIDNHNLDIVESPIIDGPFAFVPYIHDKKRFVEECNALKVYGAKTLICHNEFDGGQYDNGFYIPNGVKPEELNYDLVISGHIHTRSTIGKVRHPGSPRWMTASDANKEKGLWLVTHDSNTGAILHEEFLDTSHVCTPIYAYEYKEGDNYPEIPEGSKASVQLIGSSEWISKEKAKLKGKASISCKITDKTKPKNRKTGNSLEYFVNQVFEPISGLKKEKMVDLMRELGVL
jgi:predicted phosphodiesterase